MNAIANRRTTAIGYSLVAAGVCVFVVSCRVAGDIPCLRPDARCLVPDAFDRRSAMGYANGEECCNGACKVYPTLSERVGCCADKCPQFVDDCVAKCIATMTRPEVFKEIAAAGAFLENPLATLEQRAGATKVLHRFAEGEDLGYRLTATALLKQKPTLLARGGAKAV